MPVYALHHIGRRTVVGAYQQRVLGPCAQVVERERVGELRRKLGVTERDGGGVARVAERVELSAPRTAQTTRVVELQLVVVCQLVAHEDAGEELEVVLVKGLVALRRVALLLPGIALRVHVPVFAAQTTHHAQLAQLVLGGKVYGVQVHVVDETVVEGAVFAGVESVPTLVGPRLLRRVLLGEVALISCLYLGVLADGVLIVELHRPAAVVDVHGAILVVIHRRHIACDIVGRVLIYIVVVALPLAQSHHKVQIVLVGEVVAVVELSVEHIHVAYARCTSGHDAVGGAAACSAILVGRERPVLVASVHNHTTQRDVVFLGGVPRDTRTREDAVAHAVVVGGIALIL